MQPHERPIASSTRGALLHSPLATWIVPSPQRAARHVCDGCTVGPVWLTSAYLAATAPTARLGHLVAIHQPSFDVLAVESKSGPPLPSPHARRPTCHTARIACTILSRVSSTADDGLEGYADRLATVAQRKVCAWLVATSSSGCS